MTVLRRVTLFSAAAIGSVLLTASIAWACTTGGHVGNLWFCSGSSGCTYLQRLSGSQLNTSRSLYIMGENFASGATYQVKQHTGDGDVGTNHNCKTLGTNWGSTSAAATTSVTGYVDYKLSSAISVTLPATSGAYEMCAVDTLNSTSTADIQFTVVT